MNSLISTFSNQFCMESVNLDENELSNIKDAIREFNHYNGFSIDYRIFKKRLFYVIKKSQLVQFQNSIVDNAHEKCKNLDYFIPKLPNADFYFIIKPLIDRLRLKFTDIESISYVEETQNVQLRGSAKRLDEFLIQLCDSITKISSNKVTSISDEVSNSMNITETLQKIINEKKLFCKLIKKNDGLYLIYLLDDKSSRVSPGNATPINKDLNALSELENHILAYYTSLRKDLGVTPSEMLNIQPWSEFKTKYLLGNSEVKFRLLNVDREIIIFGKKELVFDLDSKIDEFLSQNKQSNSTLTNFDQSEVT
jgi:hypothetical protein